MNIALKYFQNLVLLCLLCIVNVYGILPEYTPALANRNRVGNNIREALITAYFRQSYSNADILLFLLNVHGIVLSLSHLKRILRRLGLKRRKQITNDTLQQTLDEVQAELNSSGKCLGYKSMWRRLRNKGIYVPRNVVRCALAVLDPEGVELRRRKRLRRREYINPGPNFVWHVDGYDKLKRYGFAIHGAIDGFSRRILWLEVGVSNNNPLVIASYFLDTILQLECVPCILRCDRGTENVHLARIQPFFRMNNEDLFSGEASFMYGRSTGNQRIESWWGILRKQGAEFWMNLFKDMVTIGLLNTDDKIHILALQFCFMHLIRHDLTRITIEWNQHLIETKRRDEGPRGKPDVIYFIPQKYDTESYGVPFNRDETMSILNEVELQNNSSNDCDPLFVELVSGLIHDWNDPNNIEEALTLYVKIVEAIERLAE